MDVPEADGFRPVECMIISHMGLRPPGNVLMSWRATWSCVLALIWRASGTSAYMRFVQLIGRERDGAEPMFLARDKVRAYTYRCLLNDLRVHLARVDADVSLSPHGWRVEGYNRSKNANGLELTVAHGGWQSDAHDRYERFRHEAVLSIPARMVGAVSSFVSEDGTREIHTARIQRGGQPGRSMMPRR